MESSFTETEKAALGWLTKQTHLKTNHARMLVGEDEGAWLNNFVKEYASGRVGSCKELRLLELGTFTGYSLICLASAAKAASKAFPDKFERCSVEAFEINDELEYLIRAGLQRAELEEFTTVHFGDAKGLLRRLPIAEAYDIVFIDANKREYPEYLSLTLPHLKKGGYILADNVLWYGKAFSPHQNTKPDAQTLGIMRFNEQVEKLTSQGVVESRLLRLRDGIYVIKKI